MIIRKCDAVQYNLNPAGGNSDASPSCIATPAGFFIGDIIMSKNPERQLMKEIEEGFLSVDKNGAIYRHKSRKGGGIQILDRPKLINRNNGRYLSVSVLRNHKTYTAGQHRLVWQYYFGNIPGGLQINHKNGIKTDNRPFNLEVVNPKDNTAHAIKMGLSNLNGECNGNSKLTEKLIKGIRLLYKNDWTVAELAEIFKVSRGNIDYIVKKKTWRHIL